jgi:uncharacterized protein (TIGR03437 family)
MRHKFFLLALLATLTLSNTPAATFGKVVSIGGHAADIALDEPRGVLYIANYTSSRIDVMSLSDNSISRSMTVAAYPGGVALSPDGHYLVVTHYASSGGSTLTQPGRDAVTVIDLVSSTKRTFGLSSGPVGVAFGIDGQAIILTQNEILQFDPASGVTTVLQEITDVQSLPLPAPTATMPRNIIAGSLIATPDGKHVFGIGGTTPDTGSGSVVLLFSYNVTNQKVTAAFVLTTAPSLGPRAISVARDASYYMTGWALFDCGPGFLGDCSADGPLLAQIANTSGELSVGSVAIRSSKNTIYAQTTQNPIPPTGTSQTQCFDNGVCITVTTPGTAAPAPSSVPPSLMVMDADNLTVRERIQIPESLAGKSIFTADESVLYSVSASGVTVLPMAQLDKAPRVTAVQEDVVFRGNFCNSGAITQTLDVVDPSGNTVPFQVCLKDSAASTVCTSVPGITISPSSGVTPAKLKISIDPTMLGSLIGTKAYTFEILSTAAVNMPRPPSRWKAETDYKTNARARFRILINNREPEDRGAFFDAPGELVDALADPARNRFYLVRQDINQVLVYDSSSYGLITTLRTGNTPTQMATTFDSNFLLVANDNSQIANRYDLTTLQAVSPIVFPRGHYPRSIAASSKAILAASRVGATGGVIDQIDLSASTAAPLSSLGPWANGVHVSTTLTPAPSGSTIFGAMPDGHVLLYNASVDAFTVSRKDFGSLKGSLAASNFGNYMVDHYFLDSSLVSQGQVINTADSSSGFAFVDQQGYSAAVTNAGAGYGYVQRIQSADGQIPLATMMVESPLLGDPDYPFRRTLAPLADRSAIIALTTSGFTVLPWNYDAVTAVPVLDRLVNAADFTKPVAPGGLVSVFGSQLSPITLAATDVPVPTILADSCLTIGGAVVPMVFTSPTQINAQLPIQISGNADVVLRTPGGISDALKIVVQPAAPSVFRSGSAGPETGIATVVRSANNQLVTNSNPIHFNDTITVYLTGMGQTLPQVPAGAAAPVAPLSSTLLQPTVTLGGADLFVGFAGLAPGFVGVYQINATVPFKNVPTGFDIPLTITQGGASTTVPLRVLN